MDSRNMKIAGETFEIFYDDHYLDKMGEDFEPSLLNLFSRLIDKRSNVVDVGANIGLTTIFFSRHASKVVSLEAAPSTFDILKNNVEKASCSNVYLLNVAAADRPGKISLTYGNANRSGGFVSHKFHLEEGHTTETAPADTLDNIVSSYLNRVDFMKFDIEGYEKYALSGASGLIAKHRPIVVMEMNHFCLNVLHRIAVPDYLDFLRSVFPVLVAVSVRSDTFVDLMDRRNDFGVMHAHMIEGEFPNLVGAFDKLPFDLSPAAAP